MFLVEVVAAEVDVAAWAGQKEISAQIRVQAQVGAKSASGWPWTSNNGIPFSRLDRPAPGEEKKNNLDYKVNSNNTNKEASQSQLTIGQVILVYQTKSVAASEHTK